MVSDVYTFISIITQVEVASSYVIVSSQKDQNIRDRSRIGQTKSAVQKMKSFVCNNSLSLNDGKRVLKCSSEPDPLHI